MENYRVTSEKICNLKDNEIFVFGSNLSGFHGGGAARIAMQWGAKWGNPTGLQGKTYAIPTKDAEIKNALSVEEIKPYVDEFIRFAKENKNLTFLVTPIGTGLAKIPINLIAELFIDCAEIENIHLPFCFWEYILLKKKYLTKEKNW